jgi:DNA-directed RNA polymerase alpha subunit
MQPNRLTHHEAICLWYDLGANKAGENGVIAFANALADRYLAKPAKRRSLDDINLSTYVYNSLRRAGYEFCDQLEHMTAEDLMSIHNIGAVAATEILSALSDD